MEVLKREHPHNYHHAVLKPETALTEVGRIYGYDLCLNNIAAMTASWQPPEDKNIPVEFPDEG